MALGNATWAGVEALGNSLVGEVVCRSNPVVSDFLFLGVSNLKGTH